MSTVANWRFCCLECVVKKQRWNSGPKSQERPNILWRMHALNAWANLVVKKCKFSKDVDSSTTPCMRDKYQSKTFRSCCCVQAALALNLFLIAHHQVFFIVVAYDLFQKILTMITKTHKRLNKNSSMRSRQQFLYHKMFHAGAEPVIMSMRIEEMHR